MLTDYGAAMQRRTVLSTKLVLSWIYIRTHTLVTKSIAIATNVICFINKHAKSFAHKQHNRRFF